MLYFAAFAGLCRLQRSTLTMNAMRRLLIPVLLALPLFGCGGGGGASAGDGASGGNGGNPASGPGAPAPASEVVVQLRSGESVDALARAYGLQVLDQFGRRPIWRLGLPASADVEATVDTLVRDARVLAAEPNVESEAPETSRRNQNEPWAIGGDAGTYAAQWAPQALRLAQAHGLSQGAGVRVAVLDTGIDLDHPALAARLQRDGAGNVLGRDFVDDDAVADEAGSRADAGWGHGTHVAGLVALAAPQARLMPVRVLDPAGQGNAWVLAEALLWAVDPDGDVATDDGAHVVNLSLGTTRPTNLLRRAIALASCDFDDDDDDDEFYRDPGFDDDRARCAARHGAVVMAAAGNSGSDTELLFPAAENAQGSLAVTASTEARRLASFANRGSWVEVAAPGELIISTVPDGGYGVWSGSSMAAPLAAGSAALLLATPAPSGDPLLPTQRQWLPTEVAKRIYDRTSQLCGGAWLRQIDAYAALTDTSAPDPACP